MSDRVEPPPHAEPTDDGADLPAWVHPLLRQLTIRGIVVIVVGAVSALLIIALAGKLTSFFGIIFTAFFLSFALEPGVNWFAARGWRRGVATGLIFFIVFLAGVGLVALVIPAIVTGAMQLIEAAPDLVDRLVKFANDLGWNISADNLTDQIQQNAQDLAGAASSLAGNVFGIAASILGGIFRWATIALFTFYIVAEGPKLRRAVCSALPPKNQERVLFVWDQAIEKTGGYFYSRLLLAVINGVGMYITLRVFSVPFAAPLAIFEGLVAAFIPIVGTYLAGIPPILVAIVALVDGGHRRARVHPDLPADRELLPQPAHHRQDDGLASCRGVRGRAARRRARRDPGGVPRLACRRCAPGSGRRLYQAVRRRGDRADLGVATGAVGRPGTHRARARQDAEGRLRRGSGRRVTVAPLHLDLRTARRLSVQAQLLSSPQPRSIEEVVRGLGEVQMDPTSAVARTEHLVLWSRLGSRFRIADLERMLWDEHSLFEYWAHIVHVDDYAIHRDSMRRFATSVPGEPGRRAYWRRWLEANASFRRYALGELRRRGPLRTRELEDRGVEGWRTGGWNDEGKNTAMMLEILWAQGKVMVAGRDGQQRLWDLAERVVPVDQRRSSPSAVARRVVDGSLRARGVATSKQIGWMFDGRAPGWERALAGLVNEGAAIPATVGDLKGPWFVHADLLDRPFRPRTTLLSPFDDLVSDRDHTERLFGFRFRLEIYVPKAKREFGYFVLPILHGDRLIGRIDPRFDRATEVLDVNAVYAQEGAPADAGAAVRRSIDGLAAWLRARDVRFTQKVPASWRSHLT